MRRNWLTKSPVCTDEAIPGLEKSLVFILKRTGPKWHKRLPSTPFSKYTFDVFVNRPSAIPTPSLHSALSSFHSNPDHSLQPSYSPFDFLTCGQQLGPLLGSIANSNLPFFGTNIRLKTNSVDNWSESQTTIIEHYYRWTLFFLLIEKHWSSTGNLRFLFNSPLYLKHL